MSNEELAERIKAGEKDLILTLWEQVRKLVIQIMRRRYLPRDGSTNHVELDDLLQAGFIGMIRAIQDYDSASGFLFTTFLNNHLLTAANEALGKKSVKNKRDPIHKATSLDEPISSQYSDLSLKDAIPDINQQYVYDDLIDELANKEDLRVIFQQVKKLKPIEQEVIIERYIEGLTFQKIGDRHKWTHQNSRFLIDKSLREIRRSKAIQTLFKERDVNRATNFYARKGLRDFNTTFSSAVEDTVILREKIRQRLQNET